MKATLGRLESSLFVDWLRFDLGGAHDKIFEVFLRVCWCHGFQGLSSVSAIIRIHPGILEVDVQCPLEISIDNVEKRHREICYSEK